MPHRTKLKRISSDNFQLSTMKCKCYVCIIFWEETFWGWKGGIGISGSPSQSMTPAIYDCANGIYEKERSTVHSMVT